MHNAIQPTMKGIINEVMMTENGERNAAKSDGELDMRTTSMYGQKTKGDITVTRNIIRELDRVS